MRGTTEEEARALAESADPAGGAPAPRVAADPAVSRARLHQGEEAARLTDALGAQAVTVGSQVYLSPRAPSLNSAAGRRLLAHELVHVVQQDRFGPRLQRFTSGERLQIAPNLAAMMAVVESVVGAASTDDRVNMDEMVRNAGGRAAGAALPRAIRSDQPPIRSMLTYRYLFTSRGGMVDMRHFFQLMYISWFGNMGSADMANRGATRRGIEHEETSEAGSKYAAEDLPSNALGAWTATRLAALPQRPDLIARVRETLERCGPVDFSALSGPSQNAIVDYYAALDASGQPLHENRTAVALVPHVPELAGHDRSFPFALDDDDPHRATIDDTAYGGGAAGLTGDTEIREFVATQREEVLRDIPGPQSERLCARLMRGWVSDDDLDAFERLYRLADAPTRARIRTANPAEDLSGGQKWRLIVFYTSNP